MNLDLLYLQDLLKLPMDTQQMKVTVRQLRGRPGRNNWKPLLEQLKETGIAKFLIDVKTENIDDFFQQVRDHLFLVDHFLDLRTGESCGISWSIL